MGVERGPLRDIFLCKVQVVALRVRSLSCASADDLPPDKEMDYAMTLNRALPLDIRVLGWAPVAPSFSARHASFSCVWSSPSRVLCSAAA